MPHSQANRLLNRINALHKSLQLDEGGSLSTMERDLMLGYLRELYEYYLSAAGQPATPPPTTPAPQPAAPRPPKAAPATPPPPAKPTPPPAPAPPPVVESKPEVSPPTPPPPKPTPKEAPSSPPTSTSKEIAALFSQPGGSDLAARLGGQSLEDLTRALTINSRLLYAKELFGDDNDLLNTTLRTLNGSGSLQAARPVLESLAKRFEWTLEGRRETAQEFIDLVRRRYA